MAQIATINPINQFFDLNGSPLNNGKLYFGEANKDPEQFPIQMYWDDAGLVPALQPIRTTSGYPVRTGSAAILYCGTKYSLRVRNKSDVQVFYVADAGSEAAAPFEAFSPTNLTPSFVSVNSFTVTGDLTAVFPPGIRVRATVTSGTVYGSVQSAVFGALTTVTLVMDTGDALDAGLSAVAVGFSPEASPVPATYAKIAEATATTTTGTSTAFVAAPFPAVASNAVPAQALLVFHVAPTGVPTLAVSGFAALPLKYRDPAGALQNPTATQVPLGWRSPLYTDGTNWIIAEVANQASQGTALTAVTQTSYDFTGIPSWVNQFDVIISGLQWNTTNELYCRGGTTAAGFVASGYLGATTTLPNAASPATNNFTAGVSFTHTGGVASTSVFRYIFEWKRVNGNTWTVKGAGSISNSPVTYNASSDITFATALDRVQITTSGGVNTSTACVGININYRA